MRRSEAWRAALLAAAVLATAGPAAAQGHRHEHPLAPHEFRGAPPDLVLWGELEKVGITVDRDSGQVQARFLPAVARLDGKTVTVVGYMNLPQAGERTRRFLLSDQPFLCDTCHATPSPRGVIDVQLKQPVAARSTAQLVTIMVRGQLQLLREAQDGVIYRLRGASVVDRNNAP